MFRKLIIFVLVLFNLIACTSNDTSEIEDGLTGSQIKALIDSQNEKIEELKIEIENLRQEKDEGEVINPFKLDNRTLYMNSRMPFGISLINDSNLKIIVYAYDTHISIYYSNDNVSEFIIGYSLVSRLMGKELSEDPEFFNNKDIVKEIDDNFVVIKVISISTDLDEVTSNKVKEMLDTIKYY
jgi:hypothetical protein